MLSTAPVRAQLRDRDADLDEQRSFLSLGVTPYLTPTTLPEAYNGLRRRLAQIIKQPVRVHTGSSLAGFHERLEQQRDDLVIVAPTDYELAGGYGYLPLLRQQAPYKAYLTTTTDSPVAALNDLRNRLIGVPPAPSPIPRLAADTLSQAGLRPGHDVILKTMRTGEACLREMLRGLIDACAVSRPPLRVVQERLQIKLRILAESSSLPGLLLMTHRGLPKTARTYLQSQLLRMSESRNGKARLREAGLGSWTQLDPQAYRAAVDAFLHPDSP